MQCPVQSMQCPVQSMRCPVQSMHCLAWKFSLRCYTGWLRGGNQGPPLQLTSFLSRGESASYQEGVEAMASALPIAVQSLLLLQSDREKMEQTWVPKQQLEEVEAEAARLREELEQEKRKSVEVKVEFKEEKRRLEESLAAAEQGLRNLTAAKEALGSKYKALEAEATQLRAELETAQKERYSRAEQLRLKEEESKERGEKLVQRDRELADITERLRQVTESEVQLTPRPSWAGREIGGAGSTTQQRVRVAVEEWGKAEERAKGLEEVAKEVEELRTCKERLDALLTVAKCDAACGCPEKKPDVEEVDVEEYLQTYLSKRFGLQGVSSAWEVERMGKDFGWVMQAQVRMRAGEA